MSGIHPARVGHSQLLFGLARLLFCTHAGEEESEEGASLALQSMVPFAALQLALPAVQPLL